MTSSSPQTPQQVNLIGIGLLGRALASRWLAQGMQVRGFDVRREACDALVAMGGEAVADVTAFGNDLAPLCLCLFEANQVDDVVRAIDPAQLRGRRIVDFTTVAPEDVLRLSAYAESHGAAWIEANVAGSSRQLEHGTATLLIAGQPAAVADVEGLLASLSEQRVYFDRAGDAARMKLVVNLALGLHRAVLAEAITLARALELPDDLALATLRACPSYSRVMDSKGDKMIRAEFSPEAKLSQHLKDVRLILAAGQARQQPLPLSQLHAELLQRLVDGPFGSLDNSAIINAWNRRPSAFDSNQADTP